MIKSIDDLHEEIRILERKSRNRDKGRRVTGRAKARIRFVNECILLLEAGLTEESASASFEKIKAQYARAKATYYAERGVDKEGNKVKRRLANFHSSGGRQMWRQIQTFKFLLK